MPWRMVDEWLLRDDDGELLGWIIRFNEEGPTHAWTPLGHIDDLACDAAARAAVERAVEVGPLRPAECRG